MADSDLGKGSSISEDEFGLEIIRDKLGFAMRNIKSGKLARYAHIL